MKENIGFVLSMLSAITVIVIFLQDRKTRKLHKETVRLLEEQCAMYKAVADQWVDLGEMAMHMPESPTGGASELCHIDIGMKVDGETRRKVRLHVFREIVEADEDEMEWSIDGKE